MLSSENKFENLTLFAFRVVSGFLFMQHGAQKLFGVLGRENPSELISVGGLAGILEFFGGIAISFGLYTSIVAFILSGQMAVAYFWRHAPRGFWPIENRGELAALYSFAFLFLAARGGGSFSIDALIQSKSNRVSEKD